MEMYTTKLVMGDWSDDGHGKTEDIVIKSNLTSKQLEAAYKKGVKKLGFDFSEVCCADYEDSEVPEEYQEKLLKAGLADYLPEDQLEGDGNWFDDFYTDHYMWVWMFIAHLGDPSLVWENAKEVNSINIGGYGLFH